MVIFGGLWGDYHTTTTTSSEYSGDLSSHQEQSLPCIPIDDDDKDDNENPSSGGRIVDFSRTRSSFEGASFLSTGSASSSAIMQIGQVSDYGATGGINDYNTSRKNQSHSSNQLHNNKNMSPNPQQPQAAAAASLRYDPNAESPSWTLGDFSETTLDVFHLCAVNLTIYILIAVIAFSYVFEHWTIIDSIYFAVNTFTTVGKLSRNVCVCDCVCVFIPNNQEVQCPTFWLFFCSVPVVMLLCHAMLCRAVPCRALLTKGYGDLEPTTQSGQMFTVIFAVYGVIILGIFIGIMGRTISERQTKTFQKLLSQKQKTVLQILFHTKESTHHMKKMEDTWLDDQQALFRDVSVVLKQEAPEILLVMFLAWIIGRREGWSIISTTYFCLMSASTTGFGDCEFKSYMEAHPPCV
jgi:hypothetical protein